MIARDTVMESDHFVKLLEAMRAQNEERAWAPDYRDILPAMYSAGYSIEEIRPNVKLWMRDIAERAVRTQEATEAEVVYPMCFAILMGCDESDRENMTATLSLSPNLFGLTRFAGFLADFLGLHHGPVVPDDLTKFFPKVRVLGTKAEREAYLGNYMRRYWYQANKRPSRHPTDRLYCGYWAWDIAAVVRVWGLDDSSFCDHKYYPKELAHYLGSPDTLVG